MTLKRQSAARAALAKAVRPSDVPKVCSPAPSASRVGVRLAHLLNQALK